MPQPRRGTNLGVDRGAWGEDVAAEYLRRGGFEIIERNPHPVDSYDGRHVYIPTLVFVVASAFEELYPHSL